MQSAGGGRGEAMHGSGDSIALNPPGGSGIRILFVDDDLDIVKSPAIGLVELNGHEVQRARGGREALERIGSFWPHLTLIDLAMPHMSGLDVARGVREMNLLSQPTLAAVSGSDGPEYKRLCAAAGFDHYLVKPMKFTELAQVVQLATPSHHGLEVLRIKFNELAYGIVRGQLEFCELVLDGAAMLRDVSAQRSRVDKVLQIQLMAATWLQKQTDLPQDQRIKLGNLMASVGERATALDEKKP